MSIRTRWLARHAPRDWHLWLLCLLPPCALVPISAEKLPQGVVRD